MRSGKSMDCPITSLRSHHLINDISDGIRRLPLHPLSGVGVGVQCKSRAVVTQRVGEGLHIHAVLKGQRGEGVPLWHNKDKSENLALQWFDGLSLFFFH